MPTFGSLFAGIGGIDLGLERAGWTGRWQVEWDEYCQRVLAKHWPDIPRYGDITTVDWSGVEPVDLIAGGFPCQPFSLAGRRRGKADDRWLWPAFAAAIRALRPRYVLVENVPGLLAGHGGMGSVLGDLAELGYDAEWDCIPAAAVGAPHLRYRVWIVAHANDVGGLRFAGLFDGFGQTFGDDPDGRSSPVSDTDSQALRDEPVPVGWRSGASVVGLDGSIGDVAHAASLRGGPLGPAVDGTRRAGRTLRGSSEVPDADRGDAQGIERQRDDPTDGRESSQRPAGLRDRERGDRAWPAEPDVGRVAHGVPARVDRLRSLGNAVVPQVVEVIGRRLMELTHLPPRMWNNDEAEL